MDTGLKNRVAIVAASSQGIGKATAEAFAAEGCHVAMCARNAAMLNQAADSIRQRFPVQVLAEVVDVTSAPSVHNFVQKVANQFGGIDICVTNAGGPPAKGFLAATYEEWQRAVELNFLSTVYFAHEVIPHMQKKHWTHRDYHVHHYKTACAGFSSVERRACCGGGIGEESGQRIRQGWHSRE